MKTISIFVPYLQKWISQVSESQNFFTKLFIYRNRIYSLNSVVVIGSFIKNKQAFAFSYVQNVIIHEFIIFCLPEFFHHSL